ncbi:hypothetical protein GGF31_008484 [Allomyces arbusculus]|nr:hypothetical protein GGF31_008484 [Allomyces arbusculus]
MISPKSKFAGALLADPRAVSPVDGAAPSPSVAPAPAPAPALPTTRARAMSIFPSVTPPPPPKPPAPPLLPKHEYTTVLRDLVIAQRHMLDMQHGATAARSRRKDLARDTFCVGPVHVAATDAAWQRRRDLHARMVAVARVNRGKGREVAGEVLVESGAGRRARFAPRQVKEQKVVRKPEPRMDVLGAKYSVRHTLVPRTPHRLPVTTNSTDAAIDHGGPRDDWNLWTPARRRARLHAQASQPTPTAPTAALPGHGVLGWEPLAPRAAFDGRAVRYAAVPARAVADALPHLAVPASAVGGNEVVGMGGSVWDAVRVLGGPLGGEDGVEGDGPVQRRGRGTVEKEEGGERMDGEEVEEEEEEEEERVGGEVVVVGERENEGVGEEVGDRGGEMVGGEGEEGDEEDEDWGEDEDEEEDGEDGEDEDESSDAGGDSDVGDNGPGSAAETVASTE